MYLQQSPGLKSGRVIEQTLGGQLNVWQAVLLWASKAHRVNMRKKKPCQAQLACKDDSSCAAITGMGMTWVLHGDRVIAWMLHGSTPLHGADMTPAWG